MAKIYKIHLTNFNEMLQFPDGTQRPIIYFEYMIMFELFNIAGAKSGDICIFVKMAELASKFKSIATKIEHGDKDEKYVIAKFDKDEIDTMRNAFVQSKQNRNPGWINEEFIPFFRQIENPEVVEI